MIITSASVYCAYYSTMRRYKSRVKKTLRFSNSDLVSSKIRFTKPLNLRETKTITLTLIYQQLYCHVVNYRQSKYKSIIAFIHPTNKYQCH